MKLSKKDKEFIERLSKTKTIREASKAFLSNLTVEEVSRLISTYLVLKSKDKEEETLQVFAREHFLPLLKTLLVSIADVLPDFITDTEFFKLNARLKKRKK